MIDFSQLASLSVVYGSVTRVQMNRPKVFNAFDETMIAELDAVFSALAKDKTVRVVVLEGKGKAFSAGADLQWMERASHASQEDNLTDARRLAHMLYTIYSLPQPVIARIHGLALGGGVGLSCACDIAFAAEEAQFAISEAKFGIVPATIGPYVLNAIGKRQASLLALTTRRIGAHQAQRIGMVHQVFPAHALDSAINALVAEILAGGPQALAEIKDLFAHLEVDVITPEVLEYTSQTIARIRSTDEAKAGFAAFLGKRPAPWIEQKQGKEQADTPPSRNGGA